MRNLSLGMQGVCFLLLLGGTAHGADPVEDDLIKRGIESRRSSDDTTALELFQKAYELHHGARAAGQVGLAEMALGMWVESEGHLREAIAERSDPWVAKYLAELERSLGRVRAHLGNLQILGGPVGAEIVIEGRVRGTLPMGKPVLVRSGSCRIDVRAPGYAAISRTVDVLSGEIARETVNLSPLPAAGPPPVALNDRPVEIHSAAPTVVTKPAAPAPQRAQRPGLRTAAIVLASAAVAAGVVGVVFGVKAKLAGEDASRAAVYDSSADDSGRRYQALQFVGYGIGAALLATGVTLFVMSRSGDTKATETAMAISVRASPRGETMAFVKAAF